MIIPKLPADKKLLTVRNPEDRFRLKSPTYVIRMIAYYHFDRLEEKEQNIHSRNRLQQIASTD
ncbi:hypothetical protein DSL64_27155 [Dyadobacter luteus]|uniref:Uncharacterized protein n=1 Tax=Dyadobacter luteus TaxID=2259619 RepID=A0A3D8Y2Y6_9BACT|nr:hypothetical protein [Dyadobacter luteus]REA56106.1 hypothetical protein DSL64_27155 [Dyadobacter luteus]